MNFGTEMKPHFKRVLSSFLAVFNARLHNPTRAARTQPLQLLTCSVIKNVTATWKTSHEQLRTDSLSCLYHSA